MFCKICFDSCRAEFNTHNVRDSSGLVCCPVLLNNKCYQCGLMGHTVKYCKNSAPVVTTKKTVSFVKDIAPATKNFTNTFALLSQELDYDSDLEFDYSLGTIIWGVGLSSMVGKSWADVCDC